MRPPHATHVGDGGLAVLGLGECPLLMVGVAPTRDHRRRGAPDRRRHRACHRQWPGRHAQQLVNALVDRAVEVVARGDPLREPGALQFVHRHRAAGHDPVTGERQADLSHEERYAGPGQRDADGELGDAHDRVVRRHADVARRGEQRSTADHVAVEAGHRDLRDPVELLEQPLPRSRAVPPRRPVTLDRRIRGRRQVRTRRERPALAREDHDAHVRSILELEQLRGQRTPHTLVQGVQLVRAGQRQSCHAIVVRHGQPGAVVSHGRIVSRGVDRPTTSSRGGRAGVGSSATPTPCPGEGTG